MLRGLRCEGLPWWLSGKESTCITGAARETCSIPGLGRPWRRAWQPTPVFLPGEFHGQRSLVGPVHEFSKSQMQLKRVSTHILRGKGKTAGRKRTVGELQAHHHCPSLPSPGSSLTPAVSASRPPAGPSPLGPRSCSPLTLLMLISDILDMNKVCSFSRLSCIMV